MATRLFHWDPIDDCVMNETDNVGGTIAVFTHLTGSFGSLISESRGSVELNHHYDPLGSTVLMTNDSGVATDQFTYDAWGNKRTSIGSSATPYQWLGRGGFLWRRHERYGHQLPGACDLGDHTSKAAQAQG